jgi:hypothetical protein
MPVFCPLRGAIKTPLAIKCMRAIALACYSAIIMLVSPPNPPLVSAVPFPAVQKTSWISNPGIVSQKFSKFQIRCLS